MGPGQGEKRLGMLLGLVFLDGSEGVQSGEEIRGVHG